MAMIGTTNVHAKSTEVIPEDSAQVKKLLAIHKDLVARITPYGKVCFDGEECDINITVLAPAVEGVARPGDQLYKAICSTCHDSGLLGAPKVGTADWTPRIAKGKATLYDHAINGFNAMPARGGADISDDEVKNAVDYILSQAK
ncbi:c-type cytochrome [Moraxella oblonga]|uniref:c-type cytochrome n=1 Tax=Moraxella oblonga TaxID=200413 RepID=UPI003F71035B